MVKFFLFFVCLFVFLFSYLFIYFFKFYCIFKLYIIVLVLPKNSALGAQYATGDLSKPGIKSAILKSPALADGFFKIIYFTY